MEPNQNPEPLHVDDPAKFAWQQIGAMAKKWLAERPSVEAVLVMRGPLNAIDLTTREQLIEVQGDLVAKGKTPLAKRRILQKFYFTVRVEQSRLVQ